MRLVAGPTHKIYVFIDDEQYTLVDPGGLKNCCTVYPSKGSLLLYVSVIFYEVRSKTINNGNGCVVPSMRANYQLYL